MYLVDVTNTNLGTHTKQTHPHPTNPPQTNKPPIGSPRRGLGPSLGPSPVCLSVVCGVCGGAAAAELSQL